MATFFSNTHKDVYHHKKRTKHTIKSPPKEPHNPKISLHIKTKKRDLYNNRPTIITYIKHRSVNLSSGIRARRKLTPHASAKSQRYKSSIAGSKARAPLGEASSKANIYCDASRESKHLE
jgi:hypothetical protein